MDSKEYSRREFLRTFAALSTVPLFASALTGCVYGPNPSSDNTTVLRMTFLDTQSHQIALSGNQAVPVHTTFVIQFNIQMNVASVATALTFIDSNNNPVAFSTSWDQYNMYVTITPTADLIPNTNYTLSVKDTATDSQGTRLTVNADASASFKTA